MGWRSRRSLWQIGAISCAAVCFLGFLLSFPVGAWAGVVLRDNETPGMSYHTLPQRTRLVALAVREEILSWRVFLLAATGILGGGTLLFAPRRRSSERPEPSWGLRLDCAAPPVEPIECTPLTPATLRIHVCANGHVHPSTNGHAGKPGSVPRPTTEVVAPRPPNREPCVATIPHHRAVAPRANGKPR
jgi:hypothetical protein